MKDTNESLIKLSACIIAKNEEELLPQCLESIKNVIDEIIVVDTGSEDTTVSIAKSYGAKVYHHPWKDNFSLHRNQSISYATGDWVLIIDCDERLFVDPSMTKEGIIEWLEQAPSDVNAIAIMVKDIQNGKLVMRCNSARIFRRKNIHYEGIVHNQPKFNGPCGLCHFMNLEHYGYGLTKEKMDAKFERSHSLLMKDYSDNPKAYQVPFYLCELYGQNGDIEQSILWGERYIGLKPEMEVADFNPSIYFTMVRNYQAKEDYSKAYEILRMGLREDPINPDLGLALSDQGTFTNEPHIVAEGARRFLKGYKQCVEKPDIMAGKFYFTLREDAFALMVYRLCISCFQEGMDAWNLFQSNKKFADKNMLKEFKSNLKSLGFKNMAKQVNNK